jgi:hypothetical protein
LKISHCEECLSRRGVLVLVWPNEPGCRRCGHVPVVQLTPREIRTCLGVEVKR